ncbi:MAG: polysaccharide pyruvyl transferase family protein [Prosthecobacter sp.]|uniref:polysaccharide pyruvyl transferase family protein n=1 Tax=Prosthecobacter sp. TaxID=1965333 RepID=UPI0039023B98
MKIACVGASGYGNVGDDTYPLVFAQQLPEHELVFYNSDLPDRLPDDLGLLVIGGGGVLHNVGAEPEDAESPHFRCMKFYLDAAIARDIPWGFISCGFQFEGQRDAAYATALKPWVPYLQQAHFITLRSSSCVRIAREISGRDDAMCFPDAAYLYQPVLAAPTAAAHAVTLVPAGFVNPRNTLINHHLRQLASSGLSVTWLSMGAPVDDAPLLEHALRCFPDSHIIANPGPQAAFDCIAHSRFVITGRYHGMIFARTNRVPFITPVDVPYKLRVEELTADIATAAGHFDVLRRFTGA